MNQANKPVSSRLSVLGLRICFIVLGAAMSHSLLAQELSVEGCPMRGSQPMTADEFIRGNESRDGRSYTKEQRAEVFKTEIEHREDDIQSKRVPWDSGRLMTKAELTACITLVNRYKSHLQDLGYSSTKSVPSDSACTHLYVGKAVQWSLGEGCLLDCTKRGLVTGIGRGVATVKSAQTGKPLEASCWSFK